MALRALVVLCLRGFSCLAVIHALYGRGWRRKEGLVGGAHEIVVQIEIGELGRGACFVEVADLPFIGL